MLISANGGGPQGPARKHGTGEAPQGFAPAKGIVVVGSVSRINAAPRQSALSAALTRTGYPCRVVSAICRPMRSAKASRYYGGPDSASFSRGTNLLASAAMRRTLLARIQARHCRFCRCRIAKSERVGKPIITESHYDSDFCWLGEGLGGLALTQGADMHNMSYLIMIISDGGLA